ncbi:hypothetical protein TorRG33x02_288460 [Trema orientale]|uniref:Uncharacterized protein n=1 Tax=Trema orientale TaxID=63057 RepID=A0A2P5CE69_TREOI|nr:hypothetical protein TorRG33x02_288460 [Trema orientale]
MLGPFRLTVEWRLIEACRSSSPATQTHSVGSPNLHCERGRAACVSRRLISLGRHLREAGLAGGHVAVGGQSTRGSGDGARDCFKRLVQTDRDKRREKGLMQLIKEE